MRSAYRVLAYLIATGVVIQAAAIAYGWFAVLDDVDGGAVFDENWEGNAGHVVHGVVGTLAIPLFALILLVVSFFAKVPDGIKWAGGIFALVVAQVLLAFISFGAPGSVSCTGSSPSRSSLRRSWPVIGWPLRHVRR